VFSPAQGAPVISVPFAQGACGTLGETPRPRRPHCCGHPACRFRKRHPGIGPAAKLNRPQNTGLACVPHANGFVGLLHVPRNCRCRRHLPGSCKLLPGHALGPSARLVGVNCLSPHGSPTSARNPQTFRPDLAAATASRSA